MIDKLYNKAKSGELLTESEIIEYTDHIRFLLSTTIVEQYFGVSDYSGCPPIDWWSALGANKQNMYNAHVYIGRDIYDWFNPSGRLLKK